MKVHEELMMARLELSRCELKKSGFNPFTKHRYFELNDILPNLEMVNKLRKLITIFSMNHEIATLKIIHTEDNSEIIFELPVVMAEMKGCSQIQMLGATQTYLRRYLLISAYEII
ncbi:MAG: ERF family protein, partial [Fusobacteriaceae bacterium]